MPLGERPLSPQFSRYLSGLTPEKFMYEPNALRNQLGLDYAKGAVNYR